tara:strand:+ start:318 stop:656 length:339 start_codon:yes stop_codon:yes gene_type:complete
MTWKDEIRKEKDVFDMDGKELYYEYKKNDKKVESIFGEINKEIQSLIKSIEVDEDKESLIDKAKTIGFNLVGHLSTMNDIISANYRLGMVGYYRDNQEIERLQEEIERLRGE